MLHGMYIGPGEDIGKTALIVVEFDQVMVQFDDLEHPKSHFWHPYPLEHWELDPVINPCAELFSGTSVRGRFKYLWSVLKHKWFVFLAGLKTKAPLWRLVIHDWTKFLPWEFKHYARNFYGDGADQAGYARAWLHHQNHNPHHWEYWWSRDSTHYSNESRFSCLDMPEHFIREMVADWMGACRTYDGFWPSKENWPWWAANQQKMSKVLTGRTYHRLIQILKETGCV